MDWNKISGLSGIGTFIVSVAMVGLMVWQQWSPQSAQVSPASQEASGMTSWILPSVLCFCIVLAAALHVVAARISNRGTHHALNKTPHAPNETEEIPISYVEKLEQAEAELDVFKKQCKWLQELAERDKSYISRYVYILFCKVSYEGLGEIEPYIEIYFNIINASVYHITIDKNIEDGAVYFNNMELNPKQAKIEGSLQNISRDDRAEKRQLVIKQWIAKPMAERMNHPQPDDKLSFDRLHINVKGADDNQEVRSQRLSLPSSIPIEH